MVDVAEGIEADEVVKGPRGLLGLTGLRRLKRIRGLLYIVSWLGHHGNKLHGFIGLRSKICEWVSGVDELDTP